MVVIGCKAALGGPVRYCKECLRGPHLSKECRERLDKHTEVSLFVDQYHYVEIHA